MPASPSSKVVPAKTSWPPSVQTAKGLTRRLFWFLGDGNTFTHVPNTYEHICVGRVFTCVYECVLKEINADTLPTHIVEFTDI